MEIIGNIYSEDNYEVFKRLYDNRTVLKSRVDKLIASISEKYILNPIIVNGKLEIIDGQGRYEACKVLGKPIHYIMVPGLTSDDCIRMNKYNTSWKALDFAQSYVKQGKQAYILLLEACEKYKMSIQRVLRMTNHGNTRNRKKPNMSAFERGMLLFDENDLETVGKVRTAADEIRDALQFTNRPNDAYYTAVKVMIEYDGYKHEHMLNNCKTLRNTYHQMSKLLDQLAEFTRIYNHHMPTKGKLYFTDFMRNKGSCVRGYENNYTPYKAKDISTLLSDKQEAK